MKIKIGLIIAGIAVGFSQLTWAQCPELCDSNENTALGQSALVNNTTGMNNTAIGFQALRNSNADGNTATGYQALMSNSSGTFNAAYGQQALALSTVGSQNTAFGAFALALNRSAAITLRSATRRFRATRQLPTRRSAGRPSAALLRAAATWPSGAGLSRRTSSAQATPLWARARSTQILVPALTPPSGRTRWLERRAANSTPRWAPMRSGRTEPVTVTSPLVSKPAVFSPTGATTFISGIKALRLSPDTFRIGEQAVQRNTYIAGISGRTIAGGVGVLIDSSGHLGTNTSSARYKEQIKPMDKASEAILSLQAGHLPLQAGARSCRHPAVRPRRRAGGEGESRSGRSRRRRQALHRPLRSGERDVAQ